MIGGRTIWVIDDDENDNILVEMTLRKAKPRCTGKFFSDAASAMQSLQRPPGADWPALIVCDVKLPGLSGFDFLSWLRSSAYRWMPVIMRSSSGKQEDIDLAHSLGANSYLVKPVLMEEAHAQFQSLSRFWFDCAHLPSPAGLDNDDPRPLFFRPEIAHLMPMLRVAFTESELRVIAKDQTFAGACMSATECEEDTTMLIKLGGAVLAARGDRASLRSTLPQCDPVNPASHGDSAASK